LIWQGRTIWLPGEEEGGGAFVYLRRRFRLGDRPRVASAFAASSVPYRLCVNGVAVGRGPAVAPPGVRYFEPYDIAPRLQRGLNVIAVLCRATPAAAAASLPGFQFQAAIERQGDAPIQILSDETWCARRQPLSVGAIQREWWSIADDLAGWQQLDYDDRAWFPAETLVVEPPAPRSRPIPPPIEECLLPVQSWSETSAREPRLAALEEPALSSAGAKGATRVLFPYTDPAGGSAEASPPRSPTPSPAALSRVDGWITLEPGERRVFDFGRHVSGHPHLRLLHAQDGVLETSYGAWVDSEGRLRAGETGGPDDWELARVEAPQELETFEPRSFRYLQVTLRDGSASVELDGVGLQQARYPWACRGRFECSDEPLTRIWALGCETLATGVRDSFVAPAGVPGPAWLGEARVQALVDYAAFGDGRLACKLLTETVTGWETQPLVLDEVASWLFLLWEHFLQTGDRTLLQRLYPAVRARVSLLNEHLDESGLLSVDHGRSGRAVVWVDDVALDRRGAVTAANAFYHRALLTAARIAASMADVPAQHEYEHRARALRNAANWRLWSLSDQAYADCHTRTGIGRRISAETNWLALAFGLAEPERASTLSRWLDRWAEWRPEPSPFFQTYALEALYALGAHTAATDRIRRLWDRFLAAGATTCWQGWPAWGEGERERGREGERDHVGVRSAVSRGPGSLPQSRSPSLPHSLSRPPAAPPNGAACWPPAAAPTSFLTRETLGVRPLAPGWVRARLRPVLGPLEWVRGVAPTPRGDMAVECRRRGERAVDLVASIPDGMRVEVGLADVRERDIVEWEGHVIWPGAQIHRGLDLEHLPRWTRDGWTWLVTGPREVRLRVRD
jgi:alpha-L-rhamnosidase